MKNADEILKLAEVIKAYRDGAIVETKYPADGDEKWDAMCNPSFTSDNLQYRIKPTYEYMNIYSRATPGNDVYTIRHPTSEAAERARTTATGVVDKDYLGTLVVEVK